MKQNTIPNGASVAIIGAGIIGVTSAFELARRGYKVTVYAPLAPGEGGPSRGNAGHIGASDIHPLSTPGIAWTGMRLMLQKDGPLKIPGLEKIRLLPWFLQFLSTSRGDRFQEASKALTYLCAKAIPHMEEMLQAADMGDLMVKGEAGYIYDSAKSLNGSRKNWTQKAAAGFTSRVMIPEEVAEKIPALNSKLRHAVASLNWAKVSDPLEIVQGIASAAVTNGVVFERAHVSRITEMHNKIAVLTPSDTKVFDAVVIAAGVGSKLFAKAQGEKLPLVAERGYNLTFPTPEIQLDMPLIMPDRGLAITQVTSGLRIGGWAEYASPDRPENQAYYKTLSHICAELFPGLNQDGAISWMGCRPSLPDSVPVISRSGTNTRVFYNCGHGHYGLTHSAISAQILGNILAEETHASENDAYSINRFN